MAERTLGRKCIWGKESTYFFFFIYFLWLTKAWMKPESQNYLLEARIIPRVLGRNDVRSSDLDVCSGGSNLHLIKHLRWFWCKLTCRSKFEKFVGVASCTDWQNWNQIVEISLAHKIVYVEKACDFGEVPDFLKYQGSSHFLFLELHRN